MDCGVRQTEHGSTSRCVHWEPKAFIAVAMPLSRQLLLSLIASSALHATLIFWQVERSGDEPGKAGASDRKPWRGRITARLSAASTNLPVSRQADLTDDTPSESKERRYLPQSQLTRKTELLSPFELDDLFPGGIAPLEPIRLRVQVSAAGKVDAIVASGNSTSEPTQHLLRTIRRWIFLPGEANGTPVPSEWEIEFSPAQPRPPD